MLVFSFRFNIVAVRILLGSNFEAPEEQREQDKHGLLSKVCCWAATIQRGQLEVCICAIERRSPSTMSKGAVFLWVGVPLGTQEPFWFEVPGVRIQLGVMQYCTTNNQSSLHPFAKIQRACSLGVPEYSGTFGDVISLINIFFCSRMGESFATTVSPKPRKEYAQMATDWSNRVHPQDLFDYRTYVGKRFSICSHGQTSSPYHCIDFLLRLLLDMRKQCHS